MPIRFKANQNEHKMAATISEMESDLDALKDCTSNEELRETLQTIAQGCSNIDKMLEDSEEAE